MIKNQRSTNKKSYHVLFIMCLLALVLALIPQNSRSEYRVYQYWVKSKSREKAELITTSLDPKAYLAYYGKENETSLNLMRSWICYGDTGGHQTPCHFEESQQSTIPSGEKPVNEVK